MQKNRKFFFVYETFITFPYAMFLDRFCSDFPNLISYTKKRNSKWYRNNCYDVICKFDFVSKCSLRCVGGQISLTGFKDSLEHLENFLKSQIKIYFGPLEIFFLKFFIYFCSYNFFLICSECINMHQNVSKCVQNERIDFYNI